MPRTVEATAAGTFAMIDMIAFRSSVIKICKEHVKLGTSSEMKSHTVAIKLTRKLWGKMTSTNHWDRPFTP